MSDDSVFVIAFCLPMRLFCKGLFKNAILNNLEETKGMNCCDCDILFLI